MVDLVIKHENVTLEIGTIGVFSSGGGGGGTSGGGWIYIEDLLDFATTVVTSKVFQDANSNILQSATSSETANRFRIRASHPKITLGGSSFDLPRLGDVFGDDIDFSIASTGTVVAQVFDANGVAGQTDDILITLDLAPVLLTLEFTGGYPGSQTELKAGDTFQVTGTLDKAADAIEIQAVGASDSVQLLTFASATTFTETMTIGDQGVVPQLLSVTARARDAVSAAFGPTLDSGLAGAVDGTNVVNLNNFFFSLSFTGETYPGGQGALKAAEQATVPFTTDFAVLAGNVIAFDSPPAELTIDTPATDASPKTVTRIAGGYNVDGDGGSTNLRAILTRGLNDAVTTVNDIINIADTAAIITDTTSEARVRTLPGVGNDSVVTLSANQELLNAPSMSPAASRGTFQGGSFAGGPKVWTRTLRVTDAENPADNSANAWLTPVATNLAGVITNTLANGTYIVGGLAQRLLNYAAVTADSTESFPLTLEANLIIGSFSDGNPGVVQPFGTADSSGGATFGHWAPTAASGVVFGHMLNTDQVASNGAGITLSFVEETA